MNDSTILYSGVFCFALMLVGVMLTIREFRKEAQLRTKFDPGDRG